MTANQQEKLQIWALLSGEAEHMPSKNISMSLEQFIHYQLEHITFRKADRKALYGMTGYVITSFKELILGVKELKTKTYRHLH